MQTSQPIEGNASEPNEEKYGFYYNNGRPFSTIDNTSNLVGSVCANEQQLGWINHLT